MLLDGLNRDVNIVRGWWKDGWVCGEDCLSGADEMGGNECWCGDLDLELCLVL